MDLKVYYLLVVTITVLCGPLVSGVALLDAPAAVKPEITKITNRNAKGWIQPYRNTILVKWRHSAAGDLIASLA